MVPTRQFVFAATRLLSNVDVDATRSNQHELGGCAVLRNFLVADGRLRPDQTEEQLSVTVVAAGYGEEAETVESTLTLYDARRNDETRSPEWRLYYPAGSEVERILQTVAIPGDQITYAVPDVGPDLVLLIIAQASGWSQNLAQIFPGSPTERLTRIATDLLEMGQGNAQMHLVLDELGLTPSPEPDALEWLLEQPELWDGISFDTFPSTATMARLGLRWCEDAVRGLQVDDRVMRRLDAESELFFALEAYLALPRFEDCKSVAEYVVLSKSVLQRRSSRRGRSFELHLATAFAEEGVAFEAQVLMPEGERVDFLFPSLSHYLNPAVDAEFLVVANAKTTARERWRQMAQEAKRIEQKHLITIDRNLTDAVVLEMNSRGIIPVIPHSIRSACSAAVIGGSMTLAEFIDNVLIANANIS